MIKASNKAALVAILTFVITAQLRADIDILADEIVATAEELEAMRGGLQVNDRHFDFAVQHLVYLDGELQARTTLSLAETIGKLNENIHRTIDAAEDRASLAVSNGVASIPVSSSSPATASGDSSLDISEPVLLLQNGPGNVFEADATTLSGLSGGTVIQNSLDDAVIQNFTVINITIPGQDLFQQSQLVDRVTQQVINSIR